MKEQLSQTPIDQPSDLELLSTSQPAIREPLVVPVSPNNPPWGSWAALGVWFASVAAIIFVPGIFLAVYLVAVGVKPEEMAAFGTTDPTALAIQVAATIPAHLLTLLLAWFVVTNYQRHPFLQTLGWSSGGMRWWHYVLLLVGFFLVASVVSQYVPETENEFTKLLQSSRTVVFLVAIMATFTAPFVEEVVYRGVVYSAWQRSFGVKGAVALVTFVFAAVHFPQYWGSWSTIGLLTLLSLLLTLLRVKTDSLLPSFILHTLFNGIQSLGLILAPYLDKTEKAGETPAFILHLLKQLIARGF